jgi:hypothetical protein
MATRYIDKVSSEDDIQDRPNASGISVHSNVAKFHNGTDVTELIDESAAQTLTNKTLTAPILTAPTLADAELTEPVITGTSPSGVLVSKRVTLTENESGTSYVGTIPVPAGAVIEDIQVIARVLWDGTSAALDVGDTGDPNGYFAAVDLKATDLVVGEMLSIKVGPDDDAGDGLWGGVNGAYLVAATGRRGPVTSNFGLSYVAGSDILFTVTPGAADGTAGRTDCVVIYSLPEAIAQVAT